MAAAVASAKRRVVVVCESWLLQEVCLGLTAACGFERLKVDVDTTFGLPRGVISARQSNGAALWGTGAPLQQHWAPGVDLALRRAALSSQRAAPYAIAAIHSQHLQRHRNPQPGICKLTANRCGNQSRVKN